MPLTSRDFQKAAEQRLTTAQFLLSWDYPLDALYLGGYAIECSLKALILETTPAAGRAAVYAKISSGSKMHQAEVLAGELRKLGVSIPIPILKRLRRFQWSVDLRYQHGRKDTAETRGMLRTAKELCDWVGGQLP